LVSTKPFFCFPVLKNEVGQLRLSPAQYFGASSRSLSGTPANLPSSHLPSTDDSGPEFGWCSLNRKTHFHIRTEMKHCTTIIAIIFFVCSNLASAQSKSKKRGGKNDDRTIVAGQLAFPTPFKIRETEILKSQIVLIEEFVPRAPPTPEGYEKLEPVERTKWYQNFIKSEAGKRFQVSEETRFSKLKKHEVQAKRDAEFRIKNVEPGNYELAGELILKHRSKKHFAEFYAKVTIADVDQIDLEKIMVEPRRMLEPMESTPAFTVRTLDGATLRSSDLKKTNTLLFFWSSGNPFCVSLIQKIIAAKEQYGSLRIVGMSLDKDEKSLREYIKKEDLPGQHIHIKDFKSEICDAFGVISIPSVWLIDRNGKIIVTDREFRDKSFDLETVLRKTMTKSLF
jgi:peroxiredoxin